MDRKMKYFEVKFPYYALIVAKDEGKAKKIYEKEITHCDDGDKIDIIEVNELKAWTLFKKVAYETDDAYNFINAKDQVLLVDGALL